MWNLLSREIVVFSLAETKASHILINKRGGNFGCGEYITAMMSAASVRLHETPTTSKSTLDCERDGENSDKKLCVIV